MTDLSLLCIPTLAFWSPGPPEMLIVLVIALMLYGGKLPEVAKTWGKTFAEFRRSLTGIQHDLNDAMYSEPERLEYRDDSYQSDGYDPPAVEVTDGDTTADYYDSDNADTGIADTGIAETDDVETDDVETDDVETVDLAATEPAPPKDKPGN